MTRNSTLLHTEKGSVAVETALMVPVVLLILWFISLAAFTWRLEGSVHRATAALSDVVSNQRLHKYDGAEESLADRIDSDVAQYGPVFLEMVSGESANATEKSLTPQIRYGLNITTFSTNAPETGTTSYTLGELVCPGTPTADSLASAGSAGNEDSLITEANIGGLMLVRVHSCVQYSGATLESVVMPNMFESTFTAVRREE